MHLDFNEICRICLKKDQETYDIFNYYFFKTNKFYCDILSYCTKIKLEETDNLPHQICKQCARTLKRVYAFNKLCEDSELKLINLLNIKNDVKSIDSPIQNDVNESEVEVKLEDVIKSENNANAVQKCEDTKDITAIENCHTAIDNSVEDTYGNDSDTVYTEDPTYCFDDEEDNMVLSKLQSSDNRIEEPVIKPPKLKRGRKKKDAGELTNKRGPHQCDVCGKIVSSKGNLNAHKLVHSNLRPYKCTECPSTFRGYSALYQHRKRHTGETRYHCEYCPKRFSRRTGLVNHVRIHTGEKEFMCTICLKKFTQNAQLTMHMKRHKGDKTFLCQECGKGFTIRGDLVVHQRIHSGDKPYTCKLCDKTFTTSGNLAIHIRIHNKEIKYTCKECNRGFVTHSSYRIHLKRHKGQKDHKCDCGKTFYTTSALKQHKVMHTGEKRYQCKICDKRFSQTSHLGRHFRKDHAKPNEPIPPSEHYKIVLPERLDWFSSSVKCEQA